MQFNGADLSPLRYQARIMPVRSLFPRTEFACRKTKYGLSQSSKGLLSLLFHTDVVVVTGADPTPQGPGGQHKGRPQGGGTPPTGEAPAGDPPAGGAGGRRRQGRPRPGRTGAAHRRPPTCQTGGAPGDPDPAQGGDRGRSRGGARKVRIHVGKTITTAPSSVQLQT